jgi:hypothetical protein
LQRKKTAICVHVYYEDGWDQIAAYLANTPPDADIFVTCREDIQVSLTHTVHAAFPEARVRVLPNIGMDILPFLLLCHNERIYEYQAVLKLHTKNTKTKLRADQGVVMFDGLCGSPELVKDIVDVFETDRDAGMVGTAFQMRSANALMYGNRTRMAAVLEQLEINLVDWPFFTGSMFWIAGHLLRDIAALAPGFLEQARMQTQGQTGGDGTLAHTLERVFGALSVASAATIYVTDRADAESGRFLVLPSWRHGPANHWRLLELGSTDLLRRYIEAAHWCATLPTCGLFDKDHYVAQMQHFAVPGMDPYYHFALYGDLFELNPSPAFDTTYYQLRRRDVAREGICSLAHYLHLGHREETPALPNEADWDIVAERLGLFDADWYSAAYPDVAQTGMAPKEHYDLIGRRLRRATSATFDPRKIPVLETDPDAHGNDLHVFLKSYFLDEELTYKVFKRAGQNGDFALARNFAGRLRNRYGPSRALNEALATSYILNGDWDKGIKTWHDFWREVKRGEDSSRHGGSGLAFDKPSQPLEGFAVAAPEAVSGCLANPVRQTGGRICVYTTLFGDIDDLIPVLNPAEGVDYLCFTDQPRNAAGWQQIIVESEHADNNMKAKAFKILPHKHLDSYDYSMFVDANTVFFGRVNELIGLCLLSGDFVMWQHPLRDDAYVEVNAIIAHRRHGPHDILEQMRHYSTEGMPRNTGKFEASFIWRKHNDSAVIEFMEAWWEQICRFSKRDQLSLSYLVWKTGFRPALLSPDLGTSRENIYFFKAPHRDGKVREIACDKGSDKGGIGAPLVQMRPRGITFLYSPEHTGTGSTILRGQQMSALVRTHVGGGRSVSYSSDTGISDRIVILTKGFLKTTTPEALRDLGRGNVLIADFVDEPPDTTLIGEIDALMASSVVGYKSYLTRFPDVPAFHVTHHVDMRIPKRKEAATDRFRAGYFGEIVNTITAPEIEELVDFNLVDTSKKTTAWIDQLGGCNFHYAFRRAREIDGAKPFLKGFVAAHCGVNMMIQTSAGDAPYYLGSDYPYMMPQDATVADIVEALQAARDGLGGPDWRYGREIMRDVAARSSVDYVMTEFTNMINAL